MTMLLPPICINCAHLHAHGLQCDAFPRIPDDILDSSYDHHKAYDGDKGIRFTAAASAFFAESPTGAPEAAGIAVVAKDTGRVLMLQRAQSDKDPASGMWEFPGGCFDDIDGGDTWRCALREWQEEMGLKLPPEAQVVDNWHSPNGVYVGFVAVVPHETSIPINMPSGFRHVPNPDDPDCDYPEVSAWWDPHDLPGNPVVRPELRAGTDWFKLYTAFLHKFNEARVPKGQPGGGEFTKGSGGGEKPKPKWGSGWTPEQAKAQEQKSKTKGPSLWEKFGFGKKDKSSSAPPGFQHLSGGHGHGHEGKDGKSYVPYVPPPPRPKYLGVWAAHLADKAKEGTALRAMLDDPKVQEAEKVNAARGDARYDKGVSVGGGRYTDEAWAENQHIADSFIHPGSKPPEGVAPTAVIMIGRPGAGKSSLISGGHVHLPAVTPVNSDDVQEKIPGFQPGLAGAYHKRATDIAKLLVDKALDQRVNILYDMTGRDPFQMEGIAKGLKKGGYNLTVVYAKTDADTANARVHQRFLEKGRYVTPELLADYTLEHGPDNSYKMLKQYASEWHQFDTTDGVKKLDEGKPEPKVEKPKELPHGG